MPTFAEQGVQGVDVDLWYGFFVPERTPGAVVTRLNNEISGILRLAEVRELFGKAGLDVATSTPAEMGELVRKDFPRWGHVIRTKGIVGE